MIVQASSGKRRVGRRSFGPVALLCALALAGCGKADKTQDVAQGKDFALSRAELDQALSQIQGVPQSAVGQVRKQVLQRLIDEKLLANAAQKEGMEQDPDTMQAVEAARRGTLARRYAERVTANIGAPSDSEIGEFYRTHPEAFGSRVAAALEQVMFAGDPAVAGKFVRMLASGTPRDQVAAQAAQQGLRPSTQAGVVTSDQLPTDVAKKIGQMTPGTTFVYNTPGGSVFALVREVRPAPMTLEQATPVIKNGLTQKRREELIQREVDRLRKEADVKVTETPGAPPAAAAPAKKG